MTVGGTYYSDPCSTDDSWYGVVCRNATATTLKLIALRMLGSIPTELGLLTGLEHIDLNTNNLKGSLPTELGLMLTVSDIIRQKRDDRIPFDRTVQVHHVIRL